MRSFKVLRSATARIQQNTRLFHGSATLQAATKATPMTGNKVVIPTSLNTAAKTMLEGNDFKVVQDADSPLEDFLGVHEDAHALIVRSEKITKEIIDKMPNLKLIVRAGAGYNTIDTKAARQAGVDVMNTPGANANAVAEEVIAMVMASFRHLIPADISTRAGKWEKKKFMGRELSKKTVGIVGLGNIGQLIVKRLKGFDVTVLGYDPMMSSQRAESLGIRLCSVETMFASCDVVTLHIPETDETRGMVNKDLLEKMVDRAVLVNCARSGVVDEDDLREHKKNGTKTMQYLTDVYPKDIAGDKPIADCADIMLPHIGANTEEANFNAASRAAQQVNDYFQKGIATHVVNRVCPEGLEPSYQKLAFAVSQIAMSIMKGLKGHSHAQPLMFDTTFYGELGEYKEYLVPSMVMGMGSKDSFDPSFDYEHAITRLEGNGITFTDREADEQKNYGESMTLDLVSGDDAEFNKVSVRGTLTDGHLMISRINQYEGLYFNPVGHSLLVEYKDTVGVIAAITQVLARYNVNVLDIRAPSDMRSGRSVCMLQLDQSIENETVKDIEILTRADRCSYFYVSE